MPSGKSKTPGITLLAAAIVLIPACEKKQSAPPPPPAAPSFPREAPPERISKKTPEAILQTLHHAAQEMALDGFQFDKPDLGWPYDCRASTSSGYLALLAEKGYLAKEDLGLFNEIEIANLSDSDPGDSAFAVIPQGKTFLFVLKDGHISNSPEKPKSSRDPAWLP
ncbi:MAG: hypothetical protein ACO3GO_04680 [Terrimicrobiaceae bacterium]